MRQKWLWLVFAVIALFMLGGCASNIKNIPAQDINAKLTSGQLVQKTNNFEMILDTSASMDEMIQWKHPSYSDRIRTSKVEYEEHLARLFNDTIPNLKLTAGLRDFAGKRVAGRNFETKLYYGMAPYVKADLGKQIYNLNTYGVESPMEVALDAATADLKPLAGTSAVIVFSDGLDMDVAPPATAKPVAAAQAMKAALKDNVCIYVVQIGSEPAARALLQKVVQAGQCGTLVNAEQVSTPAGMAALVEQVFLGPPPPPPPPPPAPVVPPVVVPPPPPAAPKQLDSIYFDFDKYTIKAEAREALKKNADWLQANKDAKVSIEGNCDERGTNEYNMALGQRRADAAAKYLMDLGVAKDRISTVSYGEEKPLCKEQTEDCWAKNRRDDFVIK